MLTNCTIHSFLRGSAYLIVSLTWTFRRLLFSNENLSLNIVALITFLLHKIPFLFCSVFTHGDVSFFDVQ